MMKENRTVCYKIYKQTREYYYHLCFEMRDDRVENARERITAFYYNNFAANNKCTTYLVADFGAYPSWKGSIRSLSGIDGMVLLAKAINGILQRMPLYDVQSMLRPTMCSKEGIALGIKVMNRKRSLTPEQLVDEIKHSSGTIFYIYTSILEGFWNFTRAWIDTDLLDPEFGIEDIEIHRIYNYNYDGYYDYDDYYDDYSDEESDIIEVIEIRKRKNRGMIKGPHECKVIKFEKRDHLDS